MVVVVEGAGEGSSTSGVVVVVGEPDWALKNGWRPVL
jgi:hypothetical protein